MPSAPMLALALVVQGSGIAEKLLPDCTTLGPSRRAESAVALRRRCGSQSSPRSGSPSPDRLRRHRARRLAARRRPRRRRPRRHAVRQRRFAHRRPSSSRRWRSRPTRASSATPGTTRSTRCRAYLQVDGFDVVHDHAGIVGPICGAMLRGRPPVVHTLARTVDTADAPALRPRRPTRAPRRRSCDAQRADNPDVPVPRHRAQRHRPRRVPVPRGQGRRPRLHRALESRQGTEGSDQHRAPRRAAAADDPEAQRAAGTRVLRARDRAAARERHRAPRERVARGRRSTCSAGRAP